MEGNPYWLGIVYCHLGDQYYILRNYDRAINYLSQALKPSQKTHLITYLLVNQNLGIAYYNNTLKHSESTECLLTFISSEDSMEMIFIDNGKGFDPVDSKKRGRGLANVRDRVESLNGSFKINSSRARGYLQN